MKASPQSSANTVQHHLIPSFITVCTPCPVGMSGMFVHSVLDHSWSSFGQPYSCHTCHFPVPLVPLTLSKNSALPSPVTNKFIIPRLIDLIIPNHYHLYFPLTLLIIEFKACSLFSPPCEKCFAMENFPTYAPVNKKKPSPLCSGFIVIALTTQPLISVDLQDSLAEFLLINTKGTSKDSFLVTVALTLS